MSRGPSNVIDQAIKLSCTGDGGLFRRCSELRWPFESFDRQHESIWMIMIAVLHRLGNENSPDVRAITKAALSPDRDGKYRYHTSLHSLARVLDAMNHAQEVYRHQFTPLSPAEVALDGQECSICLETFDSMNVGSGVEQRTGHIAVRHRQCGHIIGSGCVLRLMGPLGACAAKCPYCRCEWQWAIGSVGIKLEVIEELQYLNPQHLYQVAMGLHSIYIILVLSRPKWLDSGISQWLYHHKEKLIRMRNPHPLLRRFKWSNPYLAQPFTDYTLFDDFAALAVPRYDHGQTAISE